MLPTASIRVAVVIVEFQLTSMHAAVLIVKCQLSVTRSMALAPHALCHAGHSNIAGVQEIFEDDKHFFVVMELVSGGEVRRVLQWACYLHMWGASSKSSCASPCLSE